MDKRFLVVVAITLIALPLFAGCAVATTPDYSKIRYYLVKESKTGLNPDLIVYDTADMSGEIIDMVRPGEVFYVLKASCLGVWESDCWVWGCRKSFIPGEDMEYESCAGPKGWMPVSYTATGRLPEPFRFLLTPTAVVPPTPTPTLEPTATQTPEPTATSTSVPPTSTPTTEPTPTSVPPTQSPTRVPSTQVPSGVQCEIFVNEGSWSGVGALVVTCSGGASVQIWETSSQESSQRGEYFYFWTVASGESWNIPDWAESHWVQIRSLQGEVLRNLGFEKYNDDPDRRPPD